MALAKWLWWLGGLLFCAAGVRFALTSWQSSAASSSPPTDAGGTRPPPRGSLPEPVQRYLPPVAYEVNGEPVASRAAETPPALVFVTSSKERSEVRIDGQVVGQTPYMGQLRCQSGDFIEITLHYPGGGERGFRRSCETEIRVDDP